MTKTERWLNLIAFLLDHHYPVAREEILSQVEDYRADWNSESGRRRESARRKFERDKSELRELGVVLETSPVQVEHADQPVEGYVLRPANFYLPYIELRARGHRGPRPYGLPSVTLEPAEFPILRRAAERVAQLAGTPLATAAKSALRKLSFDLPEIDEREGERSFTASVPADFGRRFAVLLQAVRQRRAVRCRYYAIGRDEEETREIEPYGLMLSWGRWYCVARARDRKAMRVFRVDRLKGPTLVRGAPGRFDVPRGFRLESYLNRAPWELSEDQPVAVRVRIAFPQSRWVVGEGLGKIVTPVTDDGGAVLEFAVRARDPFLRWLLTFGPQAEILTPPALRRELDELRARVRARYA
ncbi:MAG TPA: WYL domain-containing protein [Gemmatimonadales bacterium]|nr:WYL domain-containing protein [Gemmatimonadales bacterium]